MGYYTGTILLKKKDTGCVRVNRLLGLGGMSSLDQVREAIFGLEHFLTSRQATFPNNNDWEQGVLVTPSNEQFRKASSSDKDKWARHFETAGRLPPPGINIPNPYWQKRKMLAQAKARYGQIQRHIDIAHILVNKQQVYLRTGDWTEKVKLTMLEVASEFPDWGEKTMRDSIHSLRFNFDGKILPATSLISASEVNRLCKEIYQMTKTSTNAGAPLLTEALNKQGIEVSQRMVGNALKLITQYEMRQLM